MKKIRNMLKNNGYIFLSFIISFAAILIVYFLQKVIPFGSNSLLKIDFYHQYGPMLAELYDRILGGKSLIYSFSTGLGLPFFRNFYNYLSSPINLIMLLFKRNNILTSYSIIIGLKASLSSVTCSYFLKNKFKSENKYIIGLSLLYAFSAYFTAYYWNIMWIDGMYMLPLITLGIENIINKNNGILYTISLSIILFINYFIGYMLCIYSVLYFILYLIIKINKKNLKEVLRIIGKFSLCSLISGLILAFQLIPMFNALLTTDATTGTMPTSQYYAFTFVEFIKNHLTGVHSTVLASGISNAPNISCGILMVFLTLLFILNKSIDFKRKLIYILFLIILLLSFYIAPLDYIWHAFHVPNDLPYRYSFIYSFILIIISAYSIRHIKDVPLYKAIISYILCLILITFVFTSKYDNISSNMIFINYLLLNLYFLIFLLNKYVDNNKNISVFIFIIVCSIESIASINNNWNINQDSLSFYSTYNSVKNTINEIKTDDNELFYRIEKNNNLTLNDGAWYGYNGQEIFSSMAYSKLSKLQTDLGMPGNRINSYYYKNNTPIYDLMFNIKYTIGPNKDDVHYERLYNEHGLYLYKFLYSNGLMFGVNNTIKDWKYDFTNPLEYQNEFVENASNIGNVFNRLVLNNSKIIYENNNDKLVKYTYKNLFNNIYIYTNDSTIDYFIINNNMYYKNGVDFEYIKRRIDIPIYNYYTYDEEYIINEFIDKSEIEIYVHYNSEYDIELDIYSMDNDKYIDFYNLINKYKVYITDFKEHYIKANINLDKNRTIFTSIPYDSGWKVYSNDKKINTFKINDSLLGFDLEKGENNILLKYEPNDLIVGIIISTITAISIVTYFILKKKINHQD